MTTKKLIQRFPGLTRDQLYSWERQGELHPVLSPRGTKGRSTREYTQEDIATVALLLQGYAAGFKPSYAREAARSGAIMGSPRLQALLASSKEMALAIFAQDRQSTLDLIALHAKELLETEACSIFLKPDSADNELYLEATAVDKRDYIRRAIRVRIESKPRGGLTGHLATLDRVVALNSEEIRTNIFSTGNPPLHLVSGECKAILVVPLRGKKNRLIGLLKFDNRKYRLATPEFDEWDQAMAIIVGNQVSMVLECLRVFDTFRQLISYIFLAPDFSNMLDQILQKAMYLCGGDRGDVAWRALSTGRLRVLVQRGDSVIPTGAELPIASIASAVYTSRQPKYVPDVAKETNYVRFDGRCRSAISVPVELPRRAVGALTIESHRPDAFDKEDLNLLQVLGQIATIASQIAGDSVSLVQGMQHAEPSGISPGSELQRCLETIRRDLKLDGVLVYCADDPRRVLQCVCYAGAAPGPRYLKRFVYSFDEEVSFATEVYRSRSARFSGDPATDPIVTEEGRKEFNIDAPLAGIPIFFSDQVVGVMVAWGANVNANFDGELNRYQQAVGGAIAAIGWRDSARRLGIVQEMLIEMRSAANPQEMIRLIIAAIRRGGFARVRAFGSEPEAFVCLDSVGNREEPRQHAGYRIPLSSSRYAQDTYELARISRVARIIRPEPGYDDPHGPALGKKMDQPWASVPLFMEGMLCGYLAADNGDSGQPISEEALLFLDALAPLAALVISRSGPNLWPHACSM